MADDSTYGDDFDDAPAAVSAPAPAPTPKPKEASAPTPAASAPTAAASVTVKADAKVDASKTASPALAVRSVADAASTSTIAAATKDAAHGMAAAEDEPAPASAAKRDAPAVGADAKSNAAATANSPKPTPSTVGSRKKSNATASAASVNTDVKATTAVAAPLSPQHCHGSMDVGIAAGCAHCKAASGAQAKNPAPEWVVEMLRKEADAAAAAAAKEQAERITATANNKTQAKVLTDESPAPPSKAAADSKADAPAKADGSASAAAAGTSATPAKDAAAAAESPAKADAVAAPANKSSSPAPAPATVSPPTSNTGSASKPATAGAASRSSSSAAAKPPTGATKRSASLHRSNGSNGSTGSNGSGPRSSSPSPSPIKPAKAGAAAGASVKPPRTSTAASDTGASKRSAQTAADRKKNDELAAKARARKEAQQKAEAESKAKKSIAPTMGPARDASPTRQLMFSNTPVPAADQSQYARNRTGAAVEGGAAPGYHRPGHSVDWSAPAALERPISPVHDLKLEDLPQDVMELRQKLHDTQKKLNTYKGKFKAAQSQIATYKQTESVKNWDKLQTMATTNDQLRAQLKEIMSILDDKISVNEPVASRYQKARANASFLVQTTNDSAVPGPASPAAHEKGGPSAAWASPGLSKSPSADTKEAAAAPVGASPPSHVRGSTAAGSVASVGRVGTAAGGMGVLARQGTGLGGGSASDGERANLEKLLKIQLHENQRLKKTLENLDPVRLQELENQLASRTHDLQQAKKEVTTLKTALASKEKGLIRAAQTGTGAALDIRGGNSTFGASDEAANAKQSATDLKVLKEKVRQYMERHVRDERLVKSYHTQLSDMRAAHNALLIKTGQRPLPGIPPQTAGGGLATSASTASIGATPISPTNAAGAVAAAGAGAGAKVSMNGAGEDKVAAGAHGGKHHRSHSNVKHHSPKHSHGGNGGGAAKEHNAADTLGDVPDGEYGYSADFS